MPDMEKVIKGIESCIKMGQLNVENCRELDCPYFENGLRLSCWIDVLTDALALIKEQECVQWINVKDKLPEKDGLYLVVYTFFDCKGMGVVRFSHNLHEIDEYIFDTENRPGWYEPDDEVGYFERTTVTHWAKLPEFPNESR